MAAESSNVATQPAQSVVVIEGKAFLRDAAGGLVELKPGDPLAEGQVLVTDAQGHIDWVNPQFERNTGYSLQEVRGRKPGLLASGQTPLTTYREMWATVLSGQSWSGQFINRRSDGSVYYDEATLLPVLDKKGRCMAIVGLQQDVTARIQVQEQLRQRIDRYSLDFKDFRDAVFSVDPTTGEITMDAVNAVRSELGAEITAVSQHLDAVEGIVNTCVTRAELGAEFERLTLVEQQIDGINGTLSQTATKSEMDALIAYLQGLGVELKSAGK